MVTKKLIYIYNILIFIICITIYWLQFMINVLPFASSGVYDLRQFGLLGQVYTIFKALLQPGAGSAFCPSSAKSYKLYVSFIYNNPFLSYSFLNIFVFWVSKLKLQFKPYDAFIIEIPSSFVVDGVDAGGLYIITGSGSGIGVGIGDGTVDDVDGTVDDVDGTVDDVDGAVDDVDGTVDGAVDDVDGTVDDVDGAVDDVDGTVDDVDGTDDDGTDDDVDGTVDGVLSDI